MSNPVSFVNTYFQAGQQYNQIMLTLQGLNCQPATDPTLAARYVTSPGARTDIIAQDIANASSAIVQFLFTWNTGAPTQKSFIYKLFP